MTTTRPPAPQMTEIGNAGIGAIRVAGRLTPQGGDLLRGTAVQLLRDVGRAVSDGGTRLQHAPRWLAEQARPGAHSSSVR